MEHIDQLAVAVRGLPNISHHRYAAAILAILATLRRVDATITASAYGGNEDNDRPPNGDNYNRVFEGIAANIWQFVDAATAEAGDIDRNNSIIGLARSQYHEEGQCEIDDDAIISDAGDNGACVSAWVWVSFAGTPLDKEAEEENETSDELGYHPDVI